jgi:hypothetical protein
LGIRHLALGIRHWTVTALGYASVAASAAANSKVRGQESGVRKGTTTDDADRTDVQGISPRRSRRYAEECGQREFFSAYLGALCGECLAVCERAIGSRRFLPCFRGLLAPDDCPLTTDSQAKPLGGRRLPPRGAISRNNHSVIASWRRDGAMALPLPRRRAARTATGRPRWAIVTAAAAAKRAIGAVRAWVTFAVACLAATLAASLAASHLGGMLRGDGDREQHPDRDNRTDKQFHEHGSSPRTRN